MKYEHIDYVDFPLKDTWLVFRNEMLNLIDYLPNIRKIVELERVEGKGKVEVTMQWYAKATLPGAAGKLIPQSVLTWVDKATWTDKEHVVEYELTLPELTNAVKVVGRNTFEKDGKRTKVTLTGDIQTEISKIKIAPKLVLRAVIPVVEVFAVKMTKPNLMELNRGIEKYLAEKKKSKKKK